MEAKAKINTIANKATNGMRATQIDFFKTVIEHTADH